MKQMKKILLSALMLTGIMATSCTDYQDEINALDSRVTKLENLVNEINTNLKALQDLAKAMEDGDFITNITKTTDGYVINFKKNEPVYIIDGKDGKDAQAHDISIAQDPTTGEWYWILNGDWLLVDGQKIRANGKDGKDGKDAIAPQVRINPDTGLWELSTDGGFTWIPTGTPAIAKGKDGKDGNQFIKSVQYYASGEEEYLIITLMSGQEIRIPVEKK
jgi:outer membrane murein-binding lipoprotein Lpp